MEFTRVHFSTLFPLLFFVLKPEGIKKLFHLSSDSYLLDQDGRTAHR